MPKWLPGKTRLQEKRPRRVNTRNRQFQVTFQQEVPVTEGQEFEVVIDDIGSHVDGTARMHGFSVFVPQSIIGERLKVRIVKVNRGFALAEKISEMGVEN